MIKEDGSAEFAGEVVIGNRPGDATRPIGVGLRESGLIQVSKNVGQTVFAAYTAGTSDAQIQILSDGIIKTTNYIYIAGDLPNNNPNIALNKNGSASFEGNVNINEFLGLSLPAVPITAYNLVVADSAGAQYAALYHGDQSFALGNIGTNTKNFYADAQGILHATGTASFGNLISDPVVKFENDGDASFSKGSITFEADGSATFAGTINGETVGTSDERFKENLTPANPQLADVVALGGILKNFDWNADAPVNEELRSQRQLGLVAQEVAEICPNLVKTIKRTKQGAELTPEQIIPAVYDEKIIPAVEDEDGNIITPETTEKVLVTPEQTIPATYEEVDDSYLALSTNALIMKLIGAVAELQAEVTALKNS